MNREATRNSRFTLAVVGLVFGLFTAGCTNPGHISKNWAGYIKAADASDPWYHVSGSFTQPDAHDIQGSPECTLALEVSWIGLGGFGGSQKLVQTGTGMTWDNRSGGSPVKSFFAWYEIFPAQSTLQVIDLSISPEDAISLNINYDPVGNPSGNPPTPPQVTFLISAPSGSKTTVKDLPNADFDGSTAEWIDESPTLLASVPKRPNGYSYLANFDHVSWTGANVRRLPSSATPEPLGSQSTGYIDNTIWYDIGSRPTPPPLAFPDGPSSVTSFTDKWAHC